MAFLYIVFDIGAKESRVQEPRTGFIANVLYNKPVQTKKIDTQPKLLLNVTMADISQAERNADYQYSLQLPDTMLSMHGRDSFKIYTRCVGRCLHGRHI
jgi:hypothetical protein